MKYSFNIQEISKAQALEMVKKYHYSNTLPHLNKKFVGFYLWDQLVGVVTLGWGTRPLHTIQKIFPTLKSEDYWEIGRMCMTEEMPRNSESQMLSQLIQWLKINFPEKKILFTWADGMMGKVGYVYQAANFKYAGFVGGEFYLKDGIKIHPRNTKALFGLDNDKRKTVRPTIEQMRDNGIKHYKGKQFRYLYLLCSKTERKKLLNKNLVPININYPKACDLTWTVKIDSRKWSSCSRPDYKGDAKFKR